MKFEIDSIKLKKILKKMQYIIPSFSHNIELTSLNIKVFKEEIIFFGKNEETEIKIVEKNVNISQEGEIFVKFKTLNEIVLKILEDKVKFFLKNENLMVLKTENSFFEINLLNVNKNNITTFNDLSENSEAFNIKNELFKTGILNVIFSGDERSPRKILRGVNFIIEDNLIKFITSDNIRFSIYKSDLISNLKINKIIPISNIKNIIKIIEDSGELRLIFNYNNFYIIDKNVFIKTKLIEGNFPKLEQLFNNIGEKKLVIKKEKLLNLIDYSTSFNSNKYSENLIVKMIIDEQTLTFESREAEVGYSKVKTKKFKFSSSELFQISFNPRLVFEALKNESNLDELVINFNNSNDPFVISYKDSEKFKCLILPFKTI